MLVSYFINIQNPSCTDGFSEWASVCVGGRDSLLDGFDDWIASRNGLTSLSICFKMPVREPMLVSYFIKIQNPLSTDGFGECASLQPSCYSLFSIDYVLLS